ncbi:MAG: ABC transporter permease [Salinibacter sp.]
MIRNYLTVAWRMLRKHPVYALVNVVGLGVAIATCLLIGLYVQDELRYDTFHPDADRTLILTLGPDDAGRQRFAPPGFGALLESEIPGVKHVTRTVVDSEVRLSPGSSRTGGGAQDARLLRADTSFFDVFPGFPVRRADRDEVLDAPGEAVLTVSAAASLFGDQDPIGRTIRAVDDSSRRYRVVGLTTVPDRSTLQFDVVVNTPGPSTSENA